MSEAPLSIIARATSRHYPVFQSLYRGFPHPHIRAGHESNDLNHLIETVTEWSRVLPNIDIVMIEDSDRV
jgi:hypothetical protein